MEEFEGATRKLIFLQEFVWVSERSWSQKFIFASSCGVYGQGDGKPKTELDEEIP